MEVLVSRHMALTWIHSRLQGMYSYLGWFDEITIPVLEESCDQKTLSTSASAELLISTTYHQYNNLDFHPQSSVLTFDLKL